MELELSQSFETFKHLVGLLKTVCVEVTLHFSAEGILVREMDPSHVAMIDLKVAPGLFDSFNTPTAETIAINVEEFAKFLDRIEKGEERVKIYLDAGEAKLVIQASKGKSRRTFSMAILAASEEEAPSPKILFKTYVKIMTDAFRKAVKDAMLVSEHIKLVSTKDAYIMSAVGDRGNAESRWETGSEDILDFKVEEESRATYVLSFLDDFANSVRNIADLLEVELSTDMPCKIKVVANHIEAYYFLAPCIT